MHLDIKRHDREVEGHDFAIQVMARAGLSTIAPAGTAIAMSSGLGALAVGASFVTGLASFASANRLIEAPPASVAAEAEVIDEPAADEAVDDGLRFFEMLED